MREKRKEEQVNRDGARPNGRDPFIPISDLNPFTCWGRQKGTIKRTDQVRVVCISPLTVKPA